MLLNLLEVTSPVFIVAFIGWIWVYLGLPFDQKAMSSIVLDLASPCLIFTSIVTTTITPDAFKQIAGVTILSLLLLALAGAIALKICRLPITPFIGIIIFTNTASMGIPISEFAFGQEGGTLAVTFFAISFVVHSIFGTALLSRTLSLKPVLKSPLVWSGLLSVTFLYFHVKVPVFVTRTTSLIGNCAVPLMLLMLGASLHHLSVKRISRAFVLAFLRLILGFFVGVLVAKLFHIHGTARGVCILECVMPVAGLNYVLAERYDQKSADVAGATLISTVLSFITLPLILRFILSSS